MVDIILYEIIKPQRVHLFILSLNGEIFLNCATSEINKL